MKPEGDGADSPTRAHEVREAARPKKNNKKTTKPLNFKPLCASKPLETHLFIHQKAKKLQPKTNATLKDTAPDERELVALLQNEATQERGFRLLLQTYQERLYWHIRAMVSAHEAADEVLQNTLVKVFRGISAFRSDARLYTWLYKIATNECLTYLAKEKRYQQRHSFDDNEQANLSNAEPYLDSQYTAQLLQKAINTLPDKQKIVFNLRYFQEMPYQEMSEMLTTSVGALKASYHHAVKKIEEFLRGQTL